MDGGNTRTATEPKSRISAHHSLVYIAMTSTLYTVLCLVFIVILLLVLVVLIYFYCCRVHKQYKYSGKTVRYSPVSDQSDDERKPSKKLKQTGLGYDGAPSYSSSSKWPTAPVSADMNISAGHLMLSYIESNLQNHNKLRKEWEGLQGYSPEATSTSVANQPDSKAKNRYPDALPYDHSRVKLIEDYNVDGMDYINASFIVDTDPGHPSYIATQGPLQNTVSDFWQMVWEQDVTVIVMLTGLADMGLSQSVQYWPSSGVSCYHDYEVRLVSEHPHSDDYIIRSLYLQNIRTRESRTVTHFQYLTWTSVSAPCQATPLLEFRRNIERAHSSWQFTPLLVHCSGGVGRTGTYILVDMALSRIQKGAKELNLAATVEHLRDSRPNMVRTKAQFEFALASLVEETHAMLDAASQHQRH